MILISFIQNLNHFDELNLYLTGCIYLINNLMLTLGTLLLNEFKKTKIKLILLY